MITVHNLQKGVAKPVVSSIVYETSQNKVVPSGQDGWQAYSGKSTITMYSPQANTETQTVDAQSLRDMSMDNVNRARLVDIAIGTGSDDLSKIVAKTGNVNLLTASKFGNWREKSYNGFSDVSERVMLQIDGNVPQTSYSIKYSTGNLDEVVLKNPIANTVTKVSNAVNDVAAITGAFTHNDRLQKAALTGERMSRFQNMQVLDIAKTQTTGGMDSVKFKFAFGQAGIFSGEEEVVKPIIALASAFALSTGEGYHSVTGPMPTKTTANRNALLKTAAAVGKLTKNDLKVDTSGDKDIATTIVEGFNEVTNKIYAVIDEVASGLIGLMKTVVIIVGGVVMGPFSVGGVSWGFDFNNVDEYGYPCEGWIQYSDLKPIRLYTKADYARQWGYSVGSTDDMDDITRKQLVEEALEKKVTEALVNDNIAEAATSNS